MEDEDALVSQIEQNIKTVEAAIEVMEELKHESQNLKRLERKGSCKVLEAQHVRGSIYCNRLYLLVIILRNQA